MKTLSNIWPEILAVIVLLLLLGCTTTVPGKTISTQMGMNRPVMKAPAVIQICNQGHQHVSLLKGDYDAIMKYVTWLEER